MAKNNNLTDFLRGVADAIRAKKGTSAPINPQDFESEIASIESGGGGSGLLRLLNDDGQGQYVRYTAQELEGLTRISRSLCTKFVNLFQFDIPSTVTHIDAYAFSGCWLSRNPENFEFSIPDSVVEIGNGAFNNCDRVQRLYIGSGITKIGGSNAIAIGTVAFRASVYIGATTPPQIASETFRAVYINNIYVPPTSVDAYKSATNWSNIASKISADPR